jgi:hypothetical protein
MLSSRSTLTLTSTCPVYLAAAAAACSAVNPQTNADDETRRESDILLCVVLRFHGPLLILLSHTCMLSCFWQLDSRTAIAPIGKASEKRDTQQANLELPPRTIHVQLPALSLRIPTLPDKHKITDGLRRSQPPTPRYRSDTRRISLSNRSTFKARAAIVGRN